MLLETLISEGVEYIFGNPGTTELPLMDALVDLPQIHYVLALHEGSAVAMADGYAQASGRPGFLNLHTAGGLGNGMGNLLNAAVSQTPLVVTAGQQDTRHSLTDPLLLGDLVRIARPAMKWAHEVTDVSQIPVLVRRAFNDARAAPTGPVFLSLPMDVMEAMTSAPVTEHSVVDRRSVACSLERLAGELAAIPPGRLAIIAGDEIHASDAADQVVRMAETLGAPVFGSSWPARIPYPTAHPLWAGNLPNHAEGIAASLGAFDAVFALGGKSLITVLYTETSAVPPGCAVFQMSADVRDLGRTYPTRLSVVGDIRASLEALQPLLDDNCAPAASERAGLVRASADRRRERRAALEQEARAQFELQPVPPLVAAHEAARAIGPEVAVVDEAIATADSLRRFLHSRSARQYSFLRGGGLGWGMPAAVGCSLGLRREPVVSLVGDGAAMYSPQALWTAANERLPITFVVMNNREYNILKNFMRRQQHYASVRSNRFIAMDLRDPLLDFQSLARAMGVAACRIERAADIAPAIEAGIASRAPNLIEIMIAPGS